MPVGVVLLTIDGGISGNSVITFDGHTWHVATPDAAPLGPTHPSEAGRWSVSCPKPSFCAAVDSAGYALTLDGEKWSQTTWLAPYMAMLTSVSCASASFCVALDLNGLTYTYNGAYWTGPTEIRGGGFSISCPSESSCGVAPASHPPFPEGYPAQYDGVQWVSALPANYKLPSYPPPHRVTQVECTPVTTNGLTLCG
jgi:hypothetical protein